MSSYRQILYHIVFRTKNSQRTLDLAQDGVIEYIKNQQEHHKKITFEDEYRKLLKEHNIEIDESYFP